MCDVFFDFTRDYLLTKFDWPFARKLVKLQPIDYKASKITIPQGMYPYELPADCRVARDLHPPGSRQKWYVQGRHLYCTKHPDEDGDVLLHYTIIAVDPSLFSYTFSQLLATGIAARIAPVLTQDADLSALLLEEFEREKFESWEADANVGNGYREYDEDPRNDTFVNPDIGTGFPTFEGE